MRIRINIALSGLFNILSGGICAGLAVAAMIDGRWITVWVGLFFTVLNLVCAHTTSYRVEDAL